METEEVFKALKKILQKHAAGLDCTSDNDREYSLDTRYIMRNSRPLFFGSVKKNKTYISYHLMPVYVNNALLDNISDKLRARMQGKSCFNFTSVDAVLFRELGSLTDKGFNSYKDKGYINQ